MKLLIGIIATMILSISTDIEAKSVGNVEISDSITFADKTLLPRGAGIRSRFFIDLYVASLFSEQGIKSRKLSSIPSYEVVNSKNVKAIRLNIVSGLITSEKMLDSIEDGFELATNGDSTEIDAYITEFKAVFDQPIEKKDQFTFISEPGLGVHVIKNDEPLTSINSELFRKALLSIWLGKKPVDKDLKKDMLGI